VVCGSAIGWAIPTLQTGIAFEITGVSPSSWDGPRPTQPPAGHTRRRADDVSQRASSDFEGRSAGQI
jgi:hypothetical protein